MSLQTVSCRFTTVSPEPFRPFQVASAVSCMTFSAVSCMTFSAVSSFIKHAQIYVAKLGGERLDCWRPIATSEGKRVASQPAPSHAPASRPQACRHVAAPSSAVRRFASLALARTCADVKPSLRALQLSSPGCGTSTSHPTARNCPTHYLPAPSARPYHVARSPSAQVSVSCAHGHARRSLLRTAPRGRFLVQPCCRCAYAPSFAPLQLPLTLLVGLPVRRAHRPLASTSLSRPLVQYATPRPRVPPSSATSRVRSASSVVAPSRSMYILYTIFVLTPLFSINPFLRAQLRSRRLRTPLSPPTRCSRTHGGSRIYDNVAAVRVCGVG